MARVTESTNYPQSGAVSSRQRSAMLLLPSTRHQHFSHGSTIIFIVGSLKSTWDMADDQGTSVDGIHGETRLRSSRVSGAIMVSLSMN